MRHAKATENHLRCERCVSAERTTRSAPSSAVYRRAGTHLSNSLHFLLLHGGLGGEVELPLVAIIIIIPMSDICVSRGR